MLRNIRKNKTGISLVELIVTITIIAVLMIILVPSLLRYIEESRAEKDNTNMEKIVSAVEVALTDYDIYKAVVRYSTSVPANYEDSENGKPGEFSATEKITKGITITFSRDQKNNKKAKISINQAVVNVGVNATKGSIQVGNIWLTDITVGSSKTLCEKITEIVGKSITLDSRTYKNSNYTIFIELDEETASAHVYGQWNGVDLFESVGLDDINPPNPGCEHSYAENITTPATCVSAGEKAYMCNKCGDIYTETIPALGHNYESVITHPTCTEQGYTTHTCSRCGDFYVDSYVDATGHSGAVQGTNNGYTTYKCDVCSSLYGTVEIIKNNRADIGYTSTTTDLIIPATIEKDDVIYTVVAIGKEAFYQCTSLESVTILNSVTSIGEKAFYKCTSLENANISNSVTTIDKYAFCYCTSLTSVIIPDGVTNIKLGTFENCSSLESVVIPNSVTNISIYAFDGCASLTSIIFNGTQSEWDAIPKGSKWDAETGDYTVYCTDGDSANIIWITKNNLNDYAYSFAVVGDTQIVALRDTQNGTQNFAKIYDYIVNNIESQKIELVLGLGDITDKNSDAEWTIANTNISKLNGKVSYILNRGNHDSAAKFDANFKNTAYKNQLEGTYDGSLVNSYFTKTIGNIKYLIMALDYGASDDILNWAAGIVDSHKDYNVIITTHAYMFRDGTTLDDGDEYSPSTTGGYNDGDDMWEKFISKHENIVLVLSGHDPCDMIVKREDNGINGNKVVQMLIDPQGMDSIELLGMVAMFHFSEDGKTVQVEYYSTIKGQYYHPNNQFTFTLDVVE